VSAGGQPQDATIRRATGADAPRIVALRDEAARWLLGRGIEQWQPGQVSEADVVGWLATGRIYVAEVSAPFAVTSERVVGCVRVAWDDDPVWGPRAPDAGYVQALVTTRSDRLRGLGRGLLTHAEDVIVRSGRPLARLSCLRGNAGLESFYAAAGYAEVGHRAFDQPGWDPVTLREKRLSSPGS
jgi:protein-tyrosine phosphatase